MTASLAFRKNEAAIFRGDVPEKYKRILGYIPGKNILEIGSAEGVLALALARQGKFVTALERSPERDRSARALGAAWDILFPDISGGVIFELGDIRDKLELLDEDFDTLVAVRMIYYLGDDLDTVFAEVAKKVPNVVLCGNGNRANRWRMGEPDEGADNFYASLEGMTALLVRHGYSIAEQVCEGDQIVVGRKEV